MTTTVFASASKTTVVVLLGLVGCAGHAQHVGDLDVADPPKEQQEHDEALAKFDRAIRLDPRDAEAHGGRGYRLLKLGRFAEATDSLDEAIRLDPDDLLAHYRRGLSLLKLGRYAEAIASIDEAIRLAPDEAEPRYVRGGCCRRLRSAGARSSRSAGVVD